MWSSPIVSVVLWTAALALTVWILVPAIAFALRIGGGVQTAILAEAGPPELPGADALLEQRLGELAALGFRAEGQTREGGRFLLPSHWRWEQFSTTRWLVSPDGLTHFTLYRIVRDEPIRMSAVTMFDGGGMVRTSCPGVPEEPVLPGYSRLSVRNLDPAALLARQQERVAAFAESYQVQPKVATIGEISSASNAALAPAIRRGAAASYAPVAFFMSALTLLPLLRLEGRSSAVALGICLMGGLYALLRWLFHGPMLRRSARRSHTMELSTAAGPDDIAPDGRILATGKNERRLRVLAVIAAVLSCAWPILLAARIPAALAHGGAIVFQLFFVALSTMLVVQFVGRARGRMVFHKGAHRDGGSMWTSWVFINTLFPKWAEWSSGSTPLRLMVGVAAASVILGIIGWRLEKQRGT